MADYKVSIQMDRTTVDTLQTGGFYLFALKAVETSSAQGDPVIWFQTNTYSTATEVNWNVSFEAYSSMDQVIPNGRIVASDNEPVKLGQTFKITGAGGTGDVTSDGVPGQIMIVSEVKNRPFSCGISQERDGVYAPICAIPINFGIANLFTPVEKVLLMFATGERDLGTVIVRSFTQAIYIDLTREQEREVTYKYGEGWSAAGAWGTLIEPGTDLSQLLVQRSSDMAVAALRSSPVFALRSGD